jgi:hypothetical protein
VTATDVRAYFSLPPWRPAVPASFTVRNLISQLENLDPNLRIRLAVNPDFPFAYFVGAEVVVHNGLAYIGEDGQDGYLPPAVREHLAWA